MRLGSAVKLTLALTAALGAAVAAYAASRPAAAAGGAGQFLGSYSWRMDKDWFGGFSALSLSRDGRAMTILSDRATLATATIRRRNGQITGIEARQAWHLKASTGKLLKGGTVDSEGLAIGRDGTIYISFEGVARITRHKQAESRARVLPRPEAFRHLPPNKALEALAIDARGNLYTLPERGLTAAGTIPVWRWNGRHWSQPFTLPPRGGFLPVSADFGPDGRFYLLERHTSLFGFRSRLRRWQITAQGPAREEILIETAAGTHDNLEGLSVWRDGNGRLRATMVSDDNFLPALQRTELVEYALPG